MTTITCDRCKFPILGAKNKFSFKTTGALTDYSSIFYDVCGTCKTMLIAMIDREFKSND